MDNKSVLAGLGAMDLARMQEQGYADALARLNAAYQTQQQQLTPTAQQAQQDPSALQPLNPMQDPNGNFARYLANKNLSLDKVFDPNVTSIEREREYVMPYLEEMWRTTNLPKATQAGLRGSQLEQAKEAFFKEGRAMALADFSDRQAEVGTTEKLGSYLNAAGRGLAGLADSVSGIVKTTAGKDNAVSGAIDSGVKLTEEALRGANNPEQQELIDYLHQLMNKGEYAKIAKLAVDYPSLGVDQLVEQVAPLGGFGKVASATGKALQRSSGVANAVKAVEGTKLGKAALATAPVSSYSALQGAGSVAQELSNAGIDPSTDGFWSVATAGLGSGALTAVLPATLEKTFLNNFKSIGLSDGTAKQATEMAKVMARNKLASAQAGGLLKTPIRYGTGLAKNAVVGSLAEGTEEGLQSALEGWAVNRHNADGSIKDHLTDEDIENIKRRAGTGALLGAGLGGAARAGANTLSRYGDNARSQEIRDNVKYWEDAEQRGEYTAPQDADTNSATRALKETADETKARLEAEKAAAEAENAIVESLKPKYGDFTQQARSDFDEKPTVDTDSVIETIVKNAPANSNVPTTTEEAKAVLDKADATTKATILTEWANATNNQDIIAGTTEAVDTLATKYGLVSAVNTKLSDNIEAITGKAVSGDINSTIDTLAKGNTELENLASVYKQAQQDGYAKTAEAVADKFTAELRRQVRNGNIKNTADTTTDTTTHAKNAVIKNLDPIGVVAGAVYGAKLPSAWSKKIQNKPLDAINDLLYQVGMSKYIPKATKQLAIDTLQQAQQKWSNGEEFDIVLPDEVYNELKALGK